MSRTATKASHWVMITASTSSTRAVQFRFVLLFFIWKLGKLIARRTTHQTQPAIPASASAA